MLRWALIFFVISLVAAFFGFAGIASATVKLLFYLFLAITAILLIAGLLVEQGVIKK